MNGSRGKQWKRALLMAFLGLAPAFPAAGATTWHVDGATTASADGLSWATAMKTIQEAVDATVIGDQIWVAEGLYFEHVVLRPCIAVYGGFSKTEATVYDRDLANHRTVVDGTGRREPEILLLEDPAGFVLDGIDVRNAAGMGLHASNASGAHGLNVSIHNCRFTGNAGAAAKIFRASCAVESCYFGNNGGDAAFDVEYGDESEQYTYSIRKSVFENNASRGLRVYGMSYVHIDDWGTERHEYYGYYDDATISVDRCATVGNGRGFSVQASAISIANCLIAENAGAICGGIFCTGGSSGFPIFISNCTIADNAGSGSGSDKGGGIYSCDGEHSEVVRYWDGTWYWHYYSIPSHLSVTNCILGANDPNGIYIDSRSEVTPKNNLFHGNAHAAQTNDDDYDTAAEVNSAFAGAADNVDGDPAFADPTVGDYRLSRNSYAIDRGTWVGLAFDLEDAPRQIDAIGIGGVGTFDIGAYEYQDPVVYNPISRQVCRGQLPIRWVNSRVAGAEVSLSLWRNGRRLRDIAGSTANDGEFLWPIPADSAGGGCQVGLASRDAPGTLQFSGVFCIVVTLPPNLISARDAGGGGIGMTWADDSRTSPSQYLSFAFDVYGNRFVSDGWAGTIWFPFPLPALSGQMNVVHSGAYHAWISGLWTDGTWLPCLNPQTLILYGGKSHCPSGAWAEDRGGGAWRLHWAPELYGTWLAQILVYQDGVGWITPVDGPSSAFPQLGPWTFVDYGGQFCDSAKGSFFEGWGDFALPPGAPLTFYLNFRAWDGLTQGPFAALGVN